MCQIAIHVERFSKEKKVWVYMPPPDGKSWYSGPPNTCLSSILGLRSCEWANPPVLLSDQSAYADIPTDASAALLAAAQCQPRHRTRELRAGWISGYPWDRIRQNAVAAGTASVEDWMVFRRCFLGATWGQIRKLQRPDLVRLVVWETEPTDAVKP